MIEFERTTDYNLIRGIMTHPRVYPGVSDDASPAAADFQPVKHPSFCYVLARDRYCGYSVDLGLWVFVPQNAVCWEVHTCLLPRHGYRRAREAARELAQWVWANTNCRRIITNVPSFNRIALRFAEDAGMRQFGINQQSYLKNGKLYDQTMLGLSPEE